MNKPERNELGELPECALMLFRFETPKVETWIVGGKEYTRCCACSKIVRINKPILESLHFCENLNDIQ